MKQCHGDLCGKVSQILGNIKVSLFLTAGWSSILRSRLRNQRSRVQIPVVSMGLRDEQLHLLTSHGCLYYFQYNV
jgi:hypothetical protein